MPIWCRLFRHTVACPLAFARLSAGSSRAARMAMIAMTTSSSMRVKQPTGEVRCYGERRARARTVGEIRNPKSEIRKEARNLKSERRLPFFGCGHSRALELRISGFLRASGFGFRISAPEPRRNPLARNRISGGGYSSSSEGAAVLHGLLQLFQQRRQFRFALRRSLAVERLKTDAPHLGFQFGAQHGWRIRIVGVPARLAGGELVTLLFEPPQRVVHCPPPLVFGQLLEGTSASV